MAQNSFYVLFGHGSPLKKGTRTLIPDNGTMIKMIPGTCTPMRSNQLVDYMLHDDTTTPADLVEHLNNINSNSKEHRSAFRIYEPMTTYSDSQIENEGTTLHHYVFDATHVNIHDITNLLHQSITHNPGYIELSRVNRYLTLLGEPYTLVVLACMQINTDMDEFVLDQLKIHPIEVVHERLNTFGYYGGKKSRIINRSMGKKRRNRKTTQRKKKHATKRR